MTRPTHSILKSSLRGLVGVTKSGYWPFSSPAPSSTEVKIKNAINAAIANLEVAVTLHESMFGKGRRSETEPPRTVIREIRTWSAADLDVAARELCDGLPKDEAEIRFCAERLAQIANDKQLTPDQVGALCWNDSAAMFDLIYQK